jgi:Fur family ferric uptake transcriptional regulator
MGPDESHAWSEHVHDVLAGAGFKRGGARERVINLLAREPCALTAGEIEDALRESGRSPGRASIYRVLDQLVDHGLAERVEVGDGQARFERQHPGGEHHHHLVCDGCGRLIAFDDPGLEQAITRLSKRLGLQVSGHDILLRGACGRCA